MLEALELYAIGSALHEAGEDPAGGHETRPGEGSEPGAGRRAACPVRRRDLRHRLREDRRHRRPEDHRARRRPGTGRCGGARHPQARVEPPATVDEGLGLSHAGTGEGNPPARGSSAGTGRPSASPRNPAVVDQLLQVETGAQAAAFEQVDEVLGGDVPGRPRGERATADPADARVEAGDTEVDGRHGVRVARIPGVVEVHPQRGVGDPGQRLPDRADQRAGPAPGPRRRSCPPAPPRRPRPVPRAPPSSTTRRGSTSPSNGQPNATASVTEHGSSGVDGARGDVLGHPHQILGTRVLVAPAEGLGHRDHDVHLVDARRHGPLETPAVEHETDVGDAGQALDPGHHGLGVRHRRHRVRPHERDGLHPPRTRGDGARDQLHLRRGRQQDRLVLQPVARAHLDDLDHDSPVSVLRDNPTTTGYSG